MVWENLKTM
jgi:hypothetical protein